MGLVSFQETLITAQSDGAALTAAAAASALPAHAKYTFPAGYLNAIGKQLEIKASGRISTPITTPGTARFDVRMGGTVVFDSLAIALDTAAAHTNVGWYLELLMTLRIVGSAAQFLTQGKFASEVVLGFGTAPRGVLEAMLPWNTAPALGTAFDATVANILDLFFTQTVATGSMTLHQFSLRALN